MALLNRPLMVDGKVWGTVFTLENAGDVFPTHVHNEADIHITVLAHGSIKCTGHPKYEGAMLEAKPGGTIVNWSPGEPHGFIALTDGATLVNLLKVRP